VLKVSPAGEGAEGDGCVLGQTRTGPIAGPLDGLIDFCRDEFAETLNVPTEIPMMHNAAPNKLRAVTNPDLEWGCLFMGVARSLRNRKWYDMWTHHR
jgi:hypothetical protein